MAPTQTENVSKQKQVSAARERILKIKRTILKIVEDMLEEEISVDWFLQNCSKLCKANYDDVIQERSIEHLCGYPLCTKPIKQITQQKYHISCTKNKVYELSERKCFCSNECYKASNFIKHQLSSLPLYMRKDSPTLKLLSEGENNALENLYGYLKVKTHRNSCFKQQKPSQATMSYGSDFGSANTPTTTIDRDLQQFIEEENHKHRFQQLVTEVNDKCWDMCIDKPGTRLDSKNETCLTNCVNRFIDTSTFILKRLEKTGAQRSEFS